MSDIALSNTILLASKTEEENVILRRKLAAFCVERGYPMESTHLAGLKSSIDILGLNVVSLAIMNCTEWTRKEIQAIRELREGEFNGYILVLAKIDPLEAKRELRHLSQNVVFLEKPFETRELHGIIRKMLLSFTVPQQVHRRYPTMQNAEVEISGKSERFSSCVRNLSKGGAYLEFNNATPARVGDQVRVTMALTQVNRTYSVPAKVVWANRSMEGQTTAVGVEFMGPPEVRKVILGSY